VLRNNQPLLAAVAATRAAAISMAVAATVAAAISLITMVGAALIAGIARASTGAIVYGRVAWRLRVFTVTYAIIAMVPAIVLKGRFGMDRLDKGFCIE